MYSDEAVTGTRTDKREDFQRMLKDCRHGKIDKILVKSISRFSRNSRDSLQAVRELSSLGVEVEFEKENISTKGMQSEFMLGTYSSFAQKESESISGNLRWSYRQRMQAGNFITCSPPLGYQLIGGKLITDEHEAKTVDNIFSSYLSGMGTQQIATELTNLGTPKKDGKTEWQRACVVYILQNEKYIGDAMLQKSYTTDALLQKTYISDVMTKKVKKNNGDLPQYYVTGHHEAIIDRDIFDQVKEKMARRQSKRKVAEKSVKTEQGKYCGKYALTELLFCGDCGTKYRRCSWFIKKTGEKKIVWRCINRLEYGPKYCKESPTIEEHKLHTAIMRAINQFVANREKGHDNLLGSLKLAYDGKNSVFDAISTQKRIAELQKSIFCINWGYD